MSPQHAYSERIDQTFCAILRRAEKQDKAAEKQRRTGKAFKLWWV